MLGLYRFNVELATPAGEACHVAIDHGRTEVVSGPAPGERLMTVRVECDLETLEELVEGRIGPVDAQVAGRLWVSGSLGTRVLTSCTFRLLSASEEVVHEEAVRDPARHRRGRRGEVHGVGAGARRALLPAPSPRS